MDDKEKRLDSENQAENNEQKAKDPLEEILESLGISKKLSDIKVNVNKDAAEKPTEEKAEEPKEESEEERPIAEAPEEKKEKDEALNRYEQKPNVQEFRSSEKAENPVKIKRNLAFFFGVLIVIFACFGIYSVAKLSVGGIISLFDNSAKIAQYNEFLVPVVANDPEPFDDIALANSADLIDITLWAILKGDLAPDQYDYKDGAMLIPAADVEKRFASLFGSEVRPVHQTITNFGYEFVYDKTDAVYKIPLTGMSPIYTPRVTDIEKKSSSIILTVAYIGGDSWTQDKQGNYIPAEPDKYMSITLREVNGEYHISAIQAKNAPETAAHTTGRAETTAAPTNVTETSAETSANDVTETAE
jgi:hypothetical protein